MTSPGMLSKGLAAALLLGLLVKTGPVLAQATGTDRAAAEVLFQEAADLAKQSRFAEACPKLEASQSFDPAVGTMLRLADCYDHVGKTASAWAVFSEVVALARQSSQAEREHVAAERAAELETRLSRIVIRTSGALPAGLEIRLNDRAIPAQSWGARLPVDPGEQSVLARAPGYQEWSTRIQLPTGPATLAVDVPALKPEPRALTAAPAEAGHVERPAARGSTQRTVGYMIGGFGLAALVGSGVLTYRAHTLNESSKNDCLKNEPNACSPSGKATRDQARSYGTAATITMAAGGVLFGTGVVLLVTAPASNAKAAARHGLEFAAFPKPHGGDLILRGAF